MLDVASDLSVQYSGRIRKKDLSMLAVPFREGRNHRHVLLFLLREKKRIYPEEIYFVRLAVRSYSIKMQSLRCI